MTPLPAPFLRGLAVLSLGGVLAVGHIAFAAAARSVPAAFAPGTQVAPDGAVEPGHERAGTGGHVPARIVVHPTRQGA